MLALGAAALAHAIWIGAVNDDAGIALAYARNFARGEGLRLTPLSPRVEAYSDPLWVLWLSVGYLLRIDGELFAQWSGAICAGAAVVLTGLLPSRAQRRAPRMIDAAAPVVLAFDTTYTYWAGAGLESGAFALALAAAMLLLARGSLWSAVPAGLLAVLRPEGPLYVAAFAFGFGTRTRARAILLWVACAALPLLLWLAFRRSYYGQWLPNSYYAKRGWDFGGLSYLSAWFLDDRWHWALLAAPLGLLARRTRRAALIAALACAAAVAFILFSRGDWMSEHRFAAHALPAAALAAGLVPMALRELLGERKINLGWLAAVALVALAGSTARARSLDRKQHPEVPLDYVADQGRWFRATATRLGLTRPRIAHFDLGGIALESGGEVIDLAGLADLYIGRVGYKSEKLVRDYLFDEVKPELLNIHGPSHYLRSDPRLSRNYTLAGSGLWGDNWVRKPLESGADDRCPAPGPGTVRLLAQEGQLAAALETAGASDARDLWLCARAHLAADLLPDVSRIGARLAADGLREADPARAKTLLDAAVTLDPRQTAAAQRLLELRLARARSPSNR